MDLLRTFITVENKYKQILEDFFSGEWRNTFLPSHDIDHHRRVWQYAKEIISLAGDGETSQDLSFCSGLIIACYLHDAGMSVDTGPEHGAFSRALAEKFFDTNSIPPGDFSEVLSVIENHDKKEADYDDDPFSLKTVLSVADDLDAFGFTGIYRYTEIYLARDISPDKIGYMIRENALTRFKNLERIYKGFDPFFRKHRARYEIVDDFFKEYNKETVQSFSGHATIEGYRGVIMVIGDLLRERLSLQEVYLHKPGVSTVTVKKWYFKRLLEELP